LVELAGFGYPHVVSLGAPIEFSEDGEPNVFPLIHTPEKIDALKEPENCRLWTLCYRVWYG